MIKEVRYIIFRFLTQSDYFYIYALPGAVKKGGGQTYFDITSIEDSAWEKFFKGIKSENIEEKRQWSFKLRSIGIRESQNIEIARRRNKNYYVKRQNINTKGANRVLAWHPDSGFPKPKNPNKRINPPKNLCIYIVRTKDNEYWAGWFASTNPCNTIACTEVLTSMVARGKDTAFLDMSGKKLFLDTNSCLTPFSVKPGKTQHGSGRALKKDVLGHLGTKIQHSFRTEDKILKDMFAEDENDKRKNKKLKASIRRIQARNKKAVKIIKELYGGKCQVTGKSVFIKRDGKPYTEIHHIIPLGEGGGDSPYNLVAINPVIHRMLHYADVSKIDLRKIKDNKLTILINAKKHTITWHPEHARFIKQIGVSQKNRITFLDKK